MTRFAIHFTVFLVFFGLWTWKLLESHPVPDEISEGLASAGLSFVAAKTLHASGYAFLTVLVLTLPAPLHWRRFLVGLLVLHGVGTEIGQTYVPNRTGKVRDVLIDWLGIALGCLVVYAWRRRYPPEAGAPR